MTQAEVRVIGGGLAGCEAAWQLAEAGRTVALIDMKPGQRTEAQVSDGLAELVCSNSLRSRNPHNAVGLLKEEMQQLGALTIKTAHRTSVPAGDALAVDRVRFSALITEAIDVHPRIARMQQQVDQLPSDGAPTIVATGPLTSAGLAASIAAITGAQGLYFYDAIAPIIAADSIDRDIAFAASRYGKGDGDDYLNCPMDKDRYHTFLAALQGAATMPLHAFEKPRFFPGCMPVEVIADSGPDSLRFGPLKPVGLTDPRTGRRPWAVVQLRKEDVDGQSYNMVGFQTKLKHPEQKRVFALIPGLENARFLRLGAIHRNTYLDSPNHLDEGMRLKRRPNLFFAGQITGVEGYVESAAHGLMVALALVQTLAGRTWQPPPPTTALGGLLAHVRGDRRLPGRDHEPQNINWGLLPPPPPDTHKREIKAARLQRARDDFSRWLNAEFPAKRALDGGQSDPHARLAGMATSIMRG